MDECWSTMEQTRINFPFFSRSVWKSSTNLEKLNQLHGKPKELHFFFPPQAYSEFPVNWLDQTVMSLCCLSESMILFWSVFIDFSHLHLVFMRKAGLLTKHKRSKPPPPNPSSCKKKTFSPFLWSFFLLFSSFFSSRLLSQRLLSHRLKRIFNY